MAMSLSRRAWIGAGLVFVAALIALMPMRFVLASSISGTSTVAASGATGTIWGGRIFDLRAGSLSIGTIDAGLRPLSLFTADYSFWFEQPSTAGVPGLRGRITKDLGGLSFEQVDGAVVLGELLPGIPLVKVEFEGVSADFADGECRSANGTVRVKPESEIFALLGIVDGLIGRARCDRGDLLLPMASGSGMERLDLRTSADGTYAAQLGLQQPSAEAAPILAQVGFVPIAGGYRISAKGKFW